LKSILMVNRKVTLCFYLWFIELFDLLLFFVESHTQHNQQRELQEQDQAITPVH
jgi:hypothetical protein